MKRRRFEVISDKFKVQRVRAEVVKFTHKKTRVSRNLCNKKMGFEFPSKLFPMLVSQIRWFKEYYINIP